MTILTQLCLMKRDTETFSITKERLRKSHACIVYGSKLPPSYFVPDFITYQEATCLVIQTIRLWGRGCPGGRA